ncbi:MAG: hypothetical protein A2Z27_02595 [candidate division Zixibacteria bacterium RBG_16_50_21]|mgnify:CR=1 FL=1|nr:MAG: hypothetical protein A2Z27_02595 [candidate division Zixibacteria bacterium RBG_16_50_21]
MMKELEIRTSRRAEMVDITAKVHTAVSDSRVVSGVCTIFIPHTTAGVTINENADPSVKQDIMEFLEKNIPHRGGYHHTEGNADSHIKAALVGTSVAVLFEQGELLLGTWQGIFFCEFDGPRQRKIWLNITGD